MVFGQIIFIEHIYLIDACSHLSHNGETILYLTGVVMRKALSADYAVPSFSCTWNTFIKNTCSKEDFSDQKSINDKGSFK